MEWQCIQGRYAESQLNATNFTSVDTCSLSSCGEDQVPTVKNRKREGSHYVLTVTFLSQTRDAQYPIF